jgi:outer membrane immunogenic protein
VLAVKKLIIGCAIAALFATPALAADMAVKALPPAAPSAPSWTGFYAGLTFGYGWEDPTTTVTATGNDLVSTALLTGKGGSLGEQPVGPVSFRNKGAFGGIEAGYNWQAGRNYVAGIEADFNVSDIKGQGATTSVLAIPGILQQLSASQNILWFGTVRPRLGWLVTDNLLLYGTGGVAYGRVNDTANYGLKRRP